MNIFFRHFEKKIFGNLYKSKKVSLHAILKTPTKNGYSECSKSGFVQYLDAQKSKFWTFCAHLDLIRFFNHKK